MVRDQDNLLIKINNMDNYLKDCVSKSDIAEIQVKLRGYAEIKQLETLEKETTSMLAKWGQEINFYRLESS